MFSHIKELFTRPSGYTISRSVRLRSSASAYFSRTVGTASNRKTFTYSAWIKRGDLTIANRILIQPNVSFEAIYFDNATNALRVQSITGTTYDLRTTQLFRDPSAWYHIVVAFDTTQATSTNRIKIYVNGLQVTAFDISTYPTQNGDTAYNNAIAQYIGGTQYFDGYMTEINWIDGQQLTPSSFGSTNALTGVWQPAKYTGTYGTNGFYLPFSDNSDVINIGYDQRSGSYSFPLRTQGTVFGGFTTAGGNSAAFDGNTDQAGGTAAACARAPAPAAGYTSASAIGRDWGTGVTKTITAFRIYAPNNGGILGLTNTGIGYKLQGSNDGTSYTDLTTATTTSGATAEVVTVTSGITTSTAYRYHRVVFNGDGANNLYLAELQLFETGSYAIGNNFYPNNISVTAGSTYDSMLDVPTMYADGGNGRGNYCVLSPIETYAAGNSFTISNGNLTYTQATATALTMAGSSFFLPYGSGKFYYEITQQTKTLVGGDATLPFVLSVLSSVSSGASTSSYYWVGNGNTSDPASATLTGVQGNTVANGDVIMVAIDLVNGKLFLGKNGTWYNSGVPASGTGAVSTNLANYSSFNPAIGNNGGNMSNFSASLNFGQQPFTYTPPTGFVALNTNNLPASTITNGAAYMAATLYTGNGSTQSISNAVNGVSFQPDLVWDKSRSLTDANFVLDSVRGATNNLYTNGTAAEFTQNTVTAFNAGGFSVGSQANGVNTNAATYVAWQWKAGTTSSSNTNGSITSTVSVGATQGFSVVSFTGVPVNASTSTIGHGLGVAPSFIILKNRDAVDDWYCQHVSLGASARISLNTTAAAVTGAGSWGNTAPTSTVFTIANNAFTTSTSQKLIVYCFAAVKGFSAFGSYTGNGSTDGPFVYLGFRPRWLMIKRSSTASVTYGWQMYDTSRQPANTASSDPNLWADTSAAEGTGNYTFDLLSNGFKLRSSGVNENASGDTYIYAAFAENPFKNALAR